MTKVEALQIHDFLKRGMVAEVTAMMAQRLATGEMPTVSDDGTFAPAGFSDPTPVPDAVANASDGPVQP